MTRILITGKGGSAGSWQIRAVQVGAALGAQVIPLASEAEIQQADVVIVVKRCPDALLDRIRRRGVPWIYDIVDAYPQPQCAEWDHLQASNWLHEWLERLKPKGVIFPTEMMRLDSSVRTRLWPTRIIPHHARPGLTMNPIRESMRVIGYEGSPSYIYGWMDEIEACCRALGCEFVMNPPQLSDLDVVLAVRDERHSGYPHLNWKSNVKLANAQASGTPVICSREAGYVETRSGGECWIDTKRQLLGILTAMQSQVAREMASTALQLGTIPITSVVPQYRRIIEQVL
jgi:hypothetical protein